MSRFPDAIAISKIKLNWNSSSNNNTSQNNFLRNDSPTCAGGIGLKKYIYTIYKLLKDVKKNLF